MGGRIFVWWVLFPSSVASRYDCPFAFTGGVPLFKIIESGVAVLFPQGFRAWSFSLLYFSIFILSPSPPISSRWFILCYWQFAREYSPNYHSLRTGPSLQARFQKGCFREECPAHPMSRKSLPLVTSPTSPDTPLVVPFHTTVRSLSASA
jgi:hypothetical protein